MTGETVAIWQKLAAPLSPGAVAWRQDGKAMPQGAKTFARFVAYIDAATVRERLDDVVPGEWALSLELLPGEHDADGVALYAFKARLTIRGVAREDVGTGKDLKAASSDSLKRVSARFGIGSELHRMYAFVQLESDSKGARPIEEPQIVYDRRQRAPAKRSSVR